MAVILVLGMLRQEALKFKARLGDSEILLKKKKNKEQNKNKTQSIKESC